MILGGAAEDSSSQYWEGGARFIGPRSTERESDHSYRSRRAVARDTEGGQANRFSIQPVSLFGEHRTKVQPDRYSLSLPSAPDDHFRPILAVARATLEINHRTAVAPHVNMAHGAFMPRSAASSPTIAPSVSILLKWHPIARSARFGLANRPLSHLGQELSSIAFFESPHGLRSLA